MSAPAPRVVLMTRKSDFEGLVARHGTREQARFFLQTHGQSLDELERRHLRLEAALQSTSQSIPAKWRRIRLERSDFSRFVFEPGDIVVVVGQDGLVANVAKYLSGQYVIGVNPDPDFYDGILVPHRAESVKKLLAAVQTKRCELEERTMVEALCDDGQRLLALNEVFIGHRTHQSARYRVRWENKEERQSSSGIIVATGTGATGWAKSIDLQRRSRIPLPRPADNALAMLVREPFPSVSTGAAISGAVLPRGKWVEVISEMNDGGVIFGDGIEDDRIEFSWGLHARMQVADLKLRLVH